MEDGAERGRRDARLGKEPPETRDHRAGRGSSGLLATLRKRGGTSAPARTKSVDVPPMSNATRHMGAGLPFPDKEFDLTVSLRDWQHRPHRIPTTLDEQIARHPGEPLVAKIHRKDPEYHYLRLEGKQRQVNGGDAEPTQSMFAPVRQIRPRSAVYRILASCLATNTELRMIAVMAKH